MADPKTQMTETAKPAVKAEPAVARTEAAKTQPGAEPKAEPVKAQPVSQPQKATVKARKARRPVKTAASKAATAPKAKKAVRKPAARKKIARTSAPVRTGAKIRKAQIQGASKMTRQTREAAGNGMFAADQFQAVFGDVNERAKGAMERTARITEELTDLTRGNMEALVASSKAAAKGIETLSQEAADYGRRSFEEASAALKNVSSMKSATDFFKLQSDFARSAFDSMVAENAKLSETMIKVVGEVAQPITSRYSVAAERVKNLAA